MVEFNEFMKDGWSYPKRCRGGSVSDEQISKVVEEKIAQAANSIANPFETAYWKDSSDGNIYLVQIVNGALSITKQESEPDQPAEDLEGLLPDRLLIWHDEFEGDTLDTSIWSYETGYKRNNEPQNYTEDSVTVANSICKITAKKRTTPLVQNVGGTDHNLTWDSGSIQSIYNAMFIEGRVEAKIRHSGKAGSWPAFWLCGFGAPWPYAVEYDVFEFWGTGKSNDHSYDTHYATAYSEHIHGAGTYQLYTDNDWHVWAVEFKRSSVEYYLDGKLINTVDFSDKKFWLGYTASTSNVYALKFPKYIKLNLAVRPEDSNYYPKHSDNMTMEIDWVRYYASVGVAELTEVNDTILSFNPWCESDGSVVLSKLKTISNVKRMPILIKQRDADSQMIYNGLIKVEPYTYTGDDVENVVNTESKGVGGISVKKAGIFTVNTRINGIDVSKTFTIK